MIVHAILYEFKSNFNGFLRCITDHDRPPNTDFIALLGQQRLRLPTGLGVAGSRPLLQTKY